MRVGLVIYGDLNTVSGGYLYDRQLVEHLRERGDSVEIFSQEPGSYGAALLDNFSSDLVESVLDAELDVLLQDELNHASLISVNRQLKRETSLPIVSIVHHLRYSENHPRWQKSLSRVLERRYLRSVDGFVFNGETTKSVVAEVAGVTEPSVIAYPAGDRFGMVLDEDEIRRRVFRDSGPRHVVFLGSVIRRKGLHDVLRALTAFDASQWVISVIGRLDVDEAYTQEIKEQIRQARLEDQVTMYGPLPDREIIRLLRSGDVLAMPSSYEGYGIAYLEGMAFGLPAIATTSGAAHEVIGHEINGWLIEPGDADRIRSILNAVPRDPNRLFEMSLAARNRFLEQPSWRESMSRIRTFLTELTGDRP
jgi:glycosyltransferase involved in cell wall biosynthesis